jgi:hypothetical protein
MISTYHEVFVGIFINYEVIGFFISIFVMVWLGLLLLFIVINGIGCFGLMGNYLFRFVFCICGLVYMLADSSVQLD